MQLQSSSHMLQRPRCSYQSHAISRPYTALGITVNFNEAKAVTICELGSLSHPARSAQALRHAIACPLHAGTSIT